MGVRWGNNLGSSDHGIWGLAVRGILLGSTVPATRIDGDLDGNGATTDLFALESVDSLLLFGLVTNINKTVAFALLEPPPVPFDDAC